MQFNNNNNRLDDYQVGWVCALPCETQASKELLDEIHQSHQPTGDDNNYILGSMEGHNVVIASTGSDGTNAAAETVTNMLRTFSNIRFGLMVGIGGGVPDVPALDDPLEDIRLGDVVVSKPHQNHGGVVQYDKGKWHDHDEFERTSHLNKPPKVLLKATAKLQIEHNDETGKINDYIKHVLDAFASRKKLKRYSSFPGRGNDQLFRSDYSHAGGKTCSNCDASCAVKRLARECDEPQIHYGTIGSANVVVKSAKYRDTLRESEKIKCFEMEAAGLMDSFPCLVIRGISDYSDSHKNDGWQQYAAVAAGAYAKDLLRVIPPKDIAATDPAATIPGVLPVTKPSPGVANFGASQQKSPSVDVTPRNQHATRCWIGLVHANDIDKVLVSRGDSFRSDLRDLMRLMVAGFGNDFDFRLGKYRDFMTKYGLRSNWHRYGGQDTLFGGLVKDKAAEKCKSEHLPDSERLRAARAFAFIQISQNGGVVQFLVYDTVVRLWQYAEGLE
ncbi:hypothetical protein ABOM_001082 [Aspergillus bombycis]|uniref:Uncharacterized protein n=1 Tax=Aspergillus bombycis TaxID=109264 RepID=A0A1F8AEW4_9EURO|nr:hypothetical protein ABOM_001082 [Aspergillus bombycis]OGM50207.1 hypothetical protein ABOM_001082 [Aspergillus bombycis]